MQAEMLIQPTNTKISTWWWYTYRNDICEHCPESRSLGGLSGTWSYDSWSSSENQGKALNSYSCPTPQQLDGSCSAICYRLEKWWSWFPGQWLSQKVIICQNLGFTVIGLVQGFKSKVGLYFLPCLKWETSVSKLHYLELREAIPYLFPSCLLQYVFSYYNKSRHCVSHLACLALVKVIWYLNSYTNCFLFREITGESHPTAILFHISLRIQR